MTGIMLSFLPLLLLLPTLVLSQSCSLSDSVKFHQTQGVDCVDPKFVKVLTGLCRELDCSILCSLEPNCKAFRLMTSGACQCKLFLFDACSHRVQSEPSCTNLVTVYVRALAGVPPGRLCPPGYQHTRYGTSYKMNTASKQNWSFGNVTCSSEPGLSKYADAIDLDEATYLRSLSRLTDSTTDFYIGGKPRVPANSLSKTGWYWTACNVSIDTSVWQPNEPNVDSGLTGCANFCTDYPTGGIDDEGCSYNQYHICECQSVF